MLIYNLTQRDVVYKGRKIPPNGGSLEFGDMSFIPTRDLELETAKVLAFGKLPRWWSPVRPEPAPVPVATPAPRRITITVADNIKVTDKVSVSSYKKK